MIRPQWWYHNRLCLAGLLLLLVPTLVSSLPHTHITRPRQGQRGGQHPLDRKRLARDDQRRRFLVQQGSKTSFALVLTTILTGGSSGSSSSSSARAVETTTTSSASNKFQTKARAEYTNSITASRDTNVSPQEAYDSILKYLPPASNDAQRALDVGAGAGLSTSYIYNKLGYKNIDGVDWSGSAWRTNVEQSPETVRFYEMDDDSFFAMLLRRDDDNAKTKYDIICYNFAVNPSKAVTVAQQYLTDTGVLFAPINDKPEYWYKQTYYTINAQGQVIQKSDADVGAWSVQFQPDVTSESCIGIWCGNANGFFEKRRANMNRL